MHPSTSPVGSTFECARRAGYASVAVAGTLALTATAAQANAPIPMVHNGPAPVTPHRFVHSITAQMSGWQPPAADSKGNVHVNLTGAAGTNAWAGAQVHNFNHHAHAGVSLSGAGGATTADLNLSSTSHDFTANTLANFQTMTIQVGDTKEVVQLGSKLTAAEYVAMQQVIATGRQTIQLGSNGEATGGTINLNRGLLGAIDRSIGGPIGSLTVSQGVRVIDSVSQLTLSGNLNNYGTIVTAAPHRGATDTISATSILNAEGAVIASYTGGGGLYGASTTLNASESLTNYGSISSIGNLNINAPVINNVVAPGSTSGVLPTISAQNNVNLNTQTINNTGTIAALGNINIASKNANLSLIGGNYLSNQLNLSGGTGNIDLNVGEVTGVINAAGNCIHLNASTDNLKLGTVDASGDPVVSNASGDIDITGANVSATNGNPLLIIAQGNITGGKGNKGIDTSSKTGTGGDVSLIAGAQFSVDGGGNVTITGGSTFGGSIDLTGKTGGSTGAVGSIKTFGVKGSDSGSVTIMAFSGLSASSGQINISKTTIDTSNKGGGSYGDVTIAAGAGIGVGGPANVLTTGNITGNNITVTTAQPTVSTTVTYDNTGKLTSSPITTGATIKNGMTVGNITTNADVTLTAGFGLTFGSITSLKTATGNSISITDLLQGITVSKPITGGNIQLISFDGGTVHQDININAPVGTIATNAVELVGQSLYTGSQGVIYGINADLTASNSIGGFNFTTFKDTVFLSKAGNLSLNTGGAATIKQAIDASIQPSTIGSNFEITGTAGLDFAGTVTSKFTSISAKNVIIEAGLIGTAQGVTITTPGSLTLTKSATVGGFMDATASTIVNAGAIGDAPGTDGNGFLSLTATAKGNAIDNQGTINTFWTTLNTPNSAGAILNEAGATVQGSLFLALNTNTVTNNGDMQFGSPSQVGTLQVIANGSLLVGGSGKFTNSDYSAVSLNANKNITISANNPFSTLSKISDFSVSTLGGTFTSPLPGMTVYTAPGGDGGSFSLFAFDNINNGAPLTGPFFVQVDASNTPIGTPTKQFIQFYLGSSKGTDLTIGKNVGDYEFHIGGNAPPNAVIFTTGHLQVDDMSALTFKSNTTTGHSGASITLQGTKGVAINGDLSTKNTDGGYTDLQIITGINAPFVIGASGPVSNGQYNLANGEGISAGNIFFVNSGGIQVSQNKVLYAEGGIKTNTAFLTVDAGATVTTPYIIFGSPAGSVTLTNNGTITPPISSNDLLIQVTSGGLTLNTGAGSSLMASQGTLTLSSTLAFITVTGPGVSGHNVTLDAPLGGITIGNATGTLITASESVSGAGGTILVNAKTLTTGTGGASFSAESNSAVTGGSVVVNLTGTKTLTVGAGGFDIDVDSQGAQGGTISLTNGGNINVTDASNLSMLNSTAGLNLSGKGVFIDDPSKLSSTLNSITINSSSTSTFLFGGAKAGANGFGVTGKTLSAVNVTVTNGSTIDMTNGFLDANSMVLTATKGAFIFAPASTLSAKTSFNSGGSIQITAQSLTNTAGTTINAAASGAGGTGGTILINLTGSKALTIGNGGLSLNASNNGNGSAGGTISVFDGANLTVDAGPSALNIGGGAGNLFGGGAGANLTLTATKGNLLVSNTDQISSINLSKVVFGSNSTTTFLLSGAPASKGNGLSYATPGNTFSADSISISNTGGSVDYTTGTLNTHSISVTAGKTLIMGNISSINPLTDAGGNGGNISLTAQTVSANGPILLDVHGVTGGTGDGGNVSVSLTAKQPLTFGGATSPFTVDISNQPGANAGSLSVSSGGNLIFDPTAGITFGTGPNGGLSLSANGNLYAPGLTAFSFTLPQTISLNSNSKTPFLLGGALPGGNGIPESNIDVLAENLTITNAGGAILAGASGSEVKSLRGSSNLVLKAGGDIGTQAFEIPLVSSDMVVVSTGSKNSAYLSLNGQFEIAQANVGKLLQVDKIGTGLLRIGDSTPGNTVKAGSININVANTITNTDNVYLDQIATTAGNLTVKSDSLGMIVEANASIKVNLGNIVLQNTGKSTASTPFILFDSGTRVHASGATSNKNQGNVTIFVGPTIPTQDHFTVGSNAPFSTATINVEGGFNQKTHLPVPGVGVFFTTDKNYSGTITSTDKKTDILTASFRALNFAGIPDTAITLNADVQITADPPPASPAALLGQTNNVSLAVLTAPNTSGLINTARGAVSSADLASSAAIPGILNLDVLNASRPSATGICIDGTQNTGSLQLNQSANNGAGLPARTGTNSNSVLQGSVSNHLHQSIDQGAVLLAPEQNTIVDTPCGRVKISAGSVALLVSSDKGVAVYDLHDTRTGAITIERDGKKTSLTPGVSAMLTKHNEHRFEEINPAGFVAYRRLTKSQFDESTTLHKGEFEPRTLMRGLPALSSMAKSDSAKAQKALGKVLKTTAILSSVMSYNEPFEYKVPPSVTAYSNATSSR